MPTIQGSNSVAAGTTVQNVLAGSQFEFLSRPSAIDVAVVQDSGGGIGQVEVLFGQEVQLSESPIGVAPLAGRGPLIPDDNVVSDVGAGGDRIILRLTNTHATLAVTIRWRVRVVPL